MRLIRITESEHEHERKPLKPPTVPMVMQTVNITGAAGHTSPICCISKEPSDIVPAVNVCGDAVHETHGLEAVWEVPDPDLE